MTSMLRLIAAAALLSLALPMDASRAQTFSPAQRTEIEAIIKNYLIKHPEVLQEVMTELEKNQAAVEAAKRQATIKNNQEKLFNSTRQVTLGNPKGNVTLVEFFDYNCGFCKRALADMMDLMKSDKNLKIVLKEFPVLGQGSVDAAKISVALMMQDKDNKKYLDFHQKLLTGRGQADRARALAVAKEVGADMARLEKDMASPEVKATLEESFKLAQDLGVNGTPSYVVGTEVVIGAVGFDALKEKVSTARCGKPTC
ncbi:MAG: DsbA family protein [Rhizobiales bacterium]|nr:DsbA family protein [Hyphomicrobiales bacterium]